MRYGGVPHARAVGAVMVWRPSPIPSRSAVLARPLVETIQRKDRDAKEWSKNHDLASQLRRAISSIALNVAGGAGDRRGQPPSDVDSAKGTSTRHFHRRYSSRRPVCAAVRMRSPISLSSGSNSSASMLRVTNFASNRGGVSARMRPCPKRYARICLFQCFS